MHVYIFLSLLICIIGLVMYLLSVRPKLVEIGKLMFFAGLFVFLMQFGPYLIGK